LLAMLPMVGRRPTLANSVRGSVEPSGLADSRREEPKAFDGLDRGGRES
jgi:hypothetical protein